MEKGQKLTAAEFISYCWEVVAWNKVSRGGEHVFSPEEELKQLDYCLEELKETVEAYNQGDLVETLDGLSDSLVTLSYLTFLVREGDSSCFSFIRPTSMPYKLACYNHRLDLGLERLEAESPLVVDAEATLLDVLGGLNYLSDKADIRGVISEVLDSNWSKFPYLDQVIPMEECKWIEDNRGKEGVTHSIIGNKVVFRDKGGKIMKPSTFKEPNIAQYIYAEEGSVSEEIKVGTVVQSLDEDTGLEPGDFFVVESVNEEESLKEGEVVYDVCSLSGWTGFVVFESWIKDSSVRVLQGDEEDCNKIDISDQVAAIREKIKLREQGEDGLQIEPCGVMKWDHTGNVKVVY